MNFREGNGEQMRGMGMFKWDTNPFTFQILPQYFVGYGKECNSILHGLNNGDKFSLLLGPTGSGKTTFLKHLGKVFDNRRVIYLPKPPKESDEWVKVFRGVIGSRFSFFRKDDTTLYSLSDRLNEKLNGDKCVLFVDECHEASQESLEWLRTITDQVNNLYIVMAGLPVFENYLHDNLETFMKRFTTFVKLTNLSKPETRELIKRRIEGAGGDDVKPFTPEVIDYVYTRTGGFPREVLKLCNDFVQKALDQGVSTIDSDLIDESRAAEQKISTDTVNELPERQKMIMEALGSGKELTPSEIIASLKVEEYKNKDNAVRSVNNILRRLMQDGLVERKKVGKTYRYKVSGKFNSVMVKA